jgi:hypothetical protein
MSNSVEYFEDKLNKCKRKANPPKKYVIFGTTFEEECEITKLSNSDLLLGHAVLHTCNGKHSETISKSKVEEFHKQFVSEMKKRNINHAQFDKLDGGL